MGSTPRARSPITVEDWIESLPPAFPSTHGHHYAAEEHQEQLQRNVQLPERKRKTSIRSRRMSRESSTRDDDESGG